MNEAYAQRLSAAGALLPTALAVLVGAGPLAGAPAAGEEPSSALEVIETALDRHEARVADIQDYTLVQEINGVEAVVYYEKATIDGAPGFRPVSAPELAYRRTRATRLGHLRNALLQGALEAGLEGAAQEVRGASEADLERILGTLQERGTATASGEPAGAGGDEESVVAAVGGSQALRQALLEGAKEAGLRLLGSALDQTVGSPFGSFVSAFERFQRGEILGGVGELGKIAAGAALLSEAGGTGALGQLLPSGGLGTLGQAAGAAVAPQQFLVGLGVAGLGALVGIGMEALFAPDFAALSRGLTPQTFAPDVYGLLRTMRGNARLAGTASVDDHPTWVLQVEDPARLGLGEGGGFVPTSVTLHLDRELLVPRRASVEGEITVEGERRPYAVRTHFGDYRRVDGALHPFRSSTVVEGMSVAVSDEERREMRQAMAKMDEEMQKVRERLDEMPPEQRAMVEQMLERQVPQMRQQMETFTSEGPMEITVEVQEMRVDQGPPLEMLRLLPDPGALNPS